MAEYRGPQTQMPPSTSYVPYDSFHHQTGIREESIPMASSYGNFRQEKQGLTASSGPAISGETSGSKLFYDNNLPPRKSAQSITSKRKRVKLLIWGIKYGLIVVLVAILLAIPILIFRNDANIEDEESLASKQYRNLFLFLFAWLEVTWLSGCVMDMFMLAFPYLFRAVARYVNPAHQRYWRIFRALRKPITMAATVVGAFIGFDTFINTNEALAVNFSKAADSWGWDDTIDDVLQQCTFWAVFYLVEKIFMLYITIHYHYRSDQGRITHSKEMHDALVTMYEASVYLYPTGSHHFIMEDNLIHGKATSGKDYASGSSEKDANQFFERIGGRGDKMGSFFGNFKSDESSHWMEGSSPYGVVERALSNPTSAAALARRIWRSLVVQGKEALIADDLAEILGPYRREEAIACFKVLDENNSGDLRLEEIVWTVIEAGRIRHSIYKGMQDINHCINTVDWIGLIFIAAVMILFIAVLYIPTIKAIQSTISFIGVGLSFALGRTLHKFIAGCIFVFFEHPFDVGDRVEIYNLAAANQVSAIVTRQSILYTIFRRVDNGTDLQITNERLAQKRIENVSRSGVNREQRTIFVDFTTSFVDLMFLRKELEAFLKANPRDYLPVLGLSVVNLHELNKLELKISVTHKSNWSEERLRATRSNKFMCTLVATVRKIPLGSPGGLRLGDEGRPIFQVHTGAEEAGAKVGSIKKKAAENRMDFVKPAPTQEELERLATDEDAKKEAEGLKQKRMRETAALTGLTMIPEIKKSSVQNEVGESTSVEVNSMIRHVNTGLRTKQ